MANHYKQKNDDWLKILEIIIQAVIAVSAVLSLFRD